MPDKPNEGFVSRWSRRKQQVAAAEKVDLKTELPSESIGADEFSELGSTNSSELSETTPIDPEVLKAEKLKALNKLTDEDMPDIETLDEHSDFSSFMSTGVSEALRNMALKKLFMGKSYNIRDGLDEYDGDYTKFEKMPTSMVTSDMKHMVQVEAKKKLEKEQEEAKQKMIAAGEFDESLEELDDIDEFAEDEAVIAEAQENYVDEHINVDGYDTTASDLDEDGKLNKNSDLDKNNQNEEVA